MIFYFDNEERFCPNMRHLIPKGKEENWLIAPGTNIKMEISQLGHDIRNLNELEESGIYWVDARGHPETWSGFTNRNKKLHILRMIPDDVISQVKQKKLRIVIAADREGTPMVTKHWDCFEKLHSIIRKRKLPINSVLLLNGNKKIKEQYNKWCLDNKQYPLMEVMYSNHFGRIFYDDHIPNGMLIEEALGNKEAKDYNSLNRTYRSHRGAHVYTLYKNNLLDSGIVSFNVVDDSDHHGAKLCKAEFFKYRSVLLNNFPKFIDGDWSVTNAANSYNGDVYRNSLMTFITETVYTQDSVFISEKIFKPLTLGHPLILLASAGTLKGLEELGFKTNWCGIDPGYNLIEDEFTRFKATHKVLLDWCQLPREEKDRRILSSMDIIQHNFELVRKKDFYREALEQAISKTKDYYNE